MVVSQGDMLEIAAYGDVLVGEFDLRADADVCLSLNHPLLLRLGFIAILDQARSKHGSVGGFANSQ